MPSPSSEDVSLPAPERPREEEFRVARREEEPDTEEEESLVDLAKRLRLGVNDEQLEGLLRGSETFVSLLQRAARHPRAEKSPEAGMLRGLVATRLHLYNERVQEYHSQEVPKPAEAAQWDETADLWGDDDDEGAAEEAPTPGAKGDPTARGANPGASTLQLRPSVGKSMERRGRSPPEGGDPAPSKPRGRKEGSQPRESLRAYSKRMSEERR